MKWVAVSSLQSSHCCTLTPLLALLQCDSLRSYSCLRGVNLQSFAVFSYTFIPYRNIKNKQQKTESYGKKSVESNTFKAVAGSQPEWLEYQEQNQTPLLKNICGFPSFPFCFFLKDLEIGDLEARIASIMVCGCESVWRWEKERQVRSVGGVTLN